MIRYCKIKNCILGLDQPKICVPLVGATEEELLSQADEIAKASCDSTIDMVEFRGDFFLELSNMDRLSSVLKAVAKKIPDQILLFTIRSEKEGGEKLSADCPSIYDINHYVIQHKLADMIDVELFSGAEDAKKLIDYAHENGVKVIMSNHDFSTTPDANVIVNRLRSMQDLGADVAKMAVMPENKMHVINLLAATTTMAENYAKVPIVTMSMGKLGAISRVTGEIFGSAITFASLKQASAPGQIPVAEMKDAMKLIHKYCI